jgi:cation transport ATPase
MGHGSQSTLASASFVLLSSSLSSLPALLHISRKVRSRQILNLGWALAFNIICIPFAAGAFYPAGGIRLTPVWSAVLMALSSVSVVMSSLALRWGL